MIHEQVSNLAGRTVRLKKTFNHPGIINDGRLEFCIEDWWDRITGNSWMIWIPACMNYAMRIGLSAGEIPMDNEVLYGKIRSFGFLVHISEIEVEP